MSALSAETLENFVALLGVEGGRRLGAREPAWSAHEAVAAHPTARRFARVVVAPHGAEGLIDTLTQLRVPT